MSDSQEFTKRCSELGTVLAVLKEINEELEQARGQVRMLEQKRNRRSVEFENLKSKLFTDFPELLPAMKPRKIKDEPQA